MFHLQGSSSPEEHGVYVWEHFVKKAKAKEVYIVAHSYGGAVTISMVRVKLMCCHSVRVKVYCYSPIVRVKVYSQCLYDPGQVY